MRGDFNIHVHRPSELLGLAKILATEKSHASWTSSQMVWHGQLSLHTLAGHMEKQETEL